ncbi:hypothetical protein [Enterococcus pseudoavium]|uniref:hypothetical protein n=1 Tax=Enterococcus pseudoavium TaxID=44007 RepID=UPI002892D8AD|nr:hypothetical protein [Enterococcus pseudoavium]
MTKILSLPLQLLFRLKMKTDPREALADEKGDRRFSNERRWVILRKNERRKGLNLQSVQLIYFFRSIRQTSFSDQIINIGRPIINSKLKIL